MTQCGHAKEGKLTSVNTKNGKSRSIPVKDKLFYEARSHLYRHGSFSFSLSAFRRALEKSGIRLPKGQCSHVLRRTFATDFVMNQGDILTLQRVLGSSSISITMRFAHLTERHLSSTMRLGPS
ncbi:tyrosine-type recombinase/integrase [Flagellimonas sp.]|uniref:tyrosine-type recombinase/integrase n=1 Tax=Flagellimonas sp. TaxID=2058762 RepID=UPI003AB5AB71